MKGLVACLPRNPLAAVAAFLVRRRRHSSSKRPQLLPGLPRELLLIILEHLDTLSLFTVLQTCKRMNSLSTESVRGLYA